MSNFSWRCKVLRSPVCTSPFSLWPLALVVFCVSCISVSVSCCGHQVRALAPLGAACVVVIQNVDVWPYVMKDSASEGAGCTIPALMIRKDNGDR